MIETKSEILFPSRLQQYVDQHAPQNLEMLSLPKNQITMVPPTKTAVPARR